MFVQLSILFILISWIILITRIIMIIMIAVQSSIIVIIINMLVTLSGISVRLQSDSSEPGRNLLLTNFPFSPWSFNPYDSVLR